MVLEMSLGFSNINFRYKLKDTFGSITLEMLKIQEKNIKNAKHS